MSVILQPWYALLDVLKWVLTALNSLFAAIPVLEPWSWGFAIMGLTVLVRLLLLPLAIKQVRFARTMKELKPAVAEIKERNKTSLHMLRTDWREFKTRRSRKEDEEMQLYREHGVNPFTGCLPLFAQAPLFIAVFRLMTDPQRVPEFTEASFFFVDNLMSSAVSLGSSAPGAWVLVTLVWVTTWYSQRQNLMKGPATVAGAGRLFLLYGLPTLLMALASIFPMGPLLFLLSMNLWTIVQQNAMFRRSPAPTLAGGAPPPDLAEGR